MNYVVLILIVAAGSWLLCYLALDLFRFHKAITKVFRGRVSYEEWTAEPGRMRFGSGYRLWEKFKDR